MKEQIFIIDDNYDICKSVKRLLNLEGYSVHTYYSSEEFLKAVPCETSGCILLDILMPGMDGFEFLEKLNSSGYEMPVIFVTVVDKEYYIDKAIKNGARGYLTKPFKSQALLNLINEAAGKTGEKIVKKES